jgi:hypothetical protein
MHHANRVVARLDKGTDPARPAARLGAAQISSLK